MSEVKKFSPKIKTPKMVKISVGDEAFVTFITGHEIEETAMGRYNVKISLLATDAEQLIAMQKVLHPAIWPEPIGEEIDDH